MEYNEYVKLNNRAWEEGWHHWHRISRSRGKIPKVEVDHCIPYEVPWDDDATCAVLHPAPDFIGELMAGGIHPPIEALHGMKSRLKTDTGEEFEALKIDIPRIRAKYNIVEEIVTDNSEAHLWVCGPMSYELAIEYCIQKDIPWEVWGKTHNRLHYAIIERTSLPERNFRDAWKLDYITENPQEQEV